jgi:hypothetical protein
MVQDEVSIAIPGHLGPGRDDRGGEYYDYETNDFVHMPPLSFKPILTIQNRISKNKRRQIVLLDAPLQIKFL